MRAQPKEIKTENKYIALKKLLKEDFETKKSIPKQIEAIRAKEEDYKEIELKCGLKIPPPSGEIQKANKLADNIIKNIDTNNSRLFNVYQDIIGSILKFVRTNDILYVTATDPKYVSAERKQYDINRFVEEASILDKKITDAFPDLQTPISKILKDMNLDNSFSLSTTYLNNFKGRLLKIYRDGLSDIFKLIAIGEGN